MPLPAVNEPMKTTIAALIVTATIAGGTVAQAIAQPQHGKQTAAASWRGHAL